MPPATNAQPAPDVAEGGLERLHAAFTDDLALVNKLIIERMQSPVALIPQLAGYIVAAGGKRLRPLLTLASAKLCGYQGDRHYGLATCVEFIHTATLLHDDVVDESLARRGQASANAEFGNQASVLVGDFLFTRAFQLMIGDGSLEVLDVLCQASATIAEGEVMQLITTNDLETDEARYLEVIEGKTAVLFAAACQVGAMVAERPANEVEALRLFGEKLGMAFQLIDDILDYSADRRSWGKQIGDDFKEGKMTLPVVLSLAAADQEQNTDERAFWERTIGRQEQDEGDLDKALELMSRHNSLELARDRAKQYAEAAVEALAPFDATDPTYQLLVDAVMASVQRQR